MYNFEINIQNHKNCNQITWKLNKNSYKIPSYTKPTLRH